MNHSIDCADRTTHLKIVVVALLAGLAVTGFAILSRVGTTMDTIGVIEAGRPVMTGMVVTLTR